MRWIKEKHDFEAILSVAKKCASRDGAAPDAELDKLTFDSVELVTRKFFQFLRHLMQLCGDETTNYVVLDPDPVSYYWAHFQRYPLLELSVDDSDDAYLSALNEDPGASPADAVGTNWSEYVLVPPSRKWFIHAWRDSRSGEGGHLWVPPNLVAIAKQVYPFGLY